MHGRPRFAKVSFHDGSKVKIAAMHPDFDVRQRAWLSLMESDGRVPIKNAHYERAWEFSGLLDHGLTCLAITS